MPNETVENHLKIKARSTIVLIVYIPENFQTVVNDCYGNHSRMSFLGPIIDCHTQQKKAPFGALVIFCCCLMASRHANNRRAQFFSQHSIRFIQRAPDRSCLVCCQCP